MHYLRAADPARSADVRLRLSRLADELVPRRRDLLVFGGYCLAATVYVVIGIAYVDFLLSFWVGVAYIVVAAWAVPAVLRRFGLIG